MKHLKRESEVVIILVAQQAMMKFMITPTSRVKPNENMVPSVEAPNAVPNTSIRITATMITVRLESRKAVKPRWKPYLIAPSMVRQALSSSRIRSAESTLPSTPMPTERIIPAIPGIVRVLLALNPKNPVTAANIPAI